MSKKKSRTQTQVSRQRLLREVASIELVCEGTVLRRTKVCGRPNCRCATDPSARHGPYYEWSRLEEGRLVHNLISAQQAHVILRAIQDQRKIQRKVKLWEKNSGQEILSGKRPKR